MAMAARAKAIMAAPEKSVANGRRNGEICENKQRNEIIRYGGKWQRKQLAWRQRLRRPANISVANGEDQLA